MSEGATPIRLQKAFCRFYNFRIRNLLKTLDKHRELWYNVRVAKIDDPLAQKVEHMTFNHGVRSSTLRWVTNHENDEL